MIVVTEGAERAEGDEIVGDEEKAHHNVAEVEILASDEDERCGDEEKFGYGVIVEADTFESPHTKTAEKGDGGENGGGYIIGGGDGEHHLIGLVEHFGDELHVVAQSGAHGWKAHHEVGEGAKSVGDETQYENDVEGTYAGFCFGVFQGFVDMLIRGYVNTFICLYVDRVMG